MKLGRAGMRAACALVVASAIGGCMAAAERAQVPADATAHARHDHAAAMPPGRQGAASGFEHDMALGMARMMADMHAPGYSGDVDVDFLAMMIPHHVGAVDMARLVLRHGSDPATRRLAEEIIAGQTIEIEGMKRRLEALRHGRTIGEGAEFPALGGTRGP